MSKKIVTDCDGVLLDWCYAYDIWMSEQGYRLEFDSSGSASCSGNGEKYLLENGIVQKLIS